MHGVALVSGGDAVRGEAPRQRGQVRDAGTVRPSLQRYVRLALLRRDGLRVLGEGAVRIDPQTQVHRLGFFSVVADQGDHVDTQVGERADGRFGLEPGKGGLVLAVQDDHEPSDTRSGGSSAAPLEVDRARLDLLGEQFRHLHGVPGDEPGRKRTVLHVLEGVVGQPLEPLPVFAQLAVPDHTHAQVVG